MPATRKSRTSTGAGAAAKGSQKTLAFNNKVTKPTVLPGKDKASVSVSVPASPSPAPAPVKAVDLDVGHVSSAAAVEEQAKVELARPVKGKVERTEAEAQAAEVTDAQIRKYWKAREAERVTPRVHQEGLSVEEKVLRLFDMSSQYGPCIGVARMKRWTRANKLGLAPPIEVLAVILKEEEKGNSKIERAYVDELMSSNVES